MEIYIQLTKKREKVLKVDQSNFKNTPPEWNELFVIDILNILESLNNLFWYWGNAYMPIPSEILGKYCCLDSWYATI